MVTGFFAQLRRSQEAESTEPVVEGHYDQPLLSQRFAVEVRAGASAAAEASAVDPHVDRALFPGIGCPCPDIGSEAVFAHVVLVAATWSATLWADFPELIGLAHAFPGNWRLRSA